MTDLSLLTQVQNDLDAARAKHAQMQADLDTQGGIVAGLIRQLRELITGLDADCRAVEAGFLHVAKTITQEIETELHKIL